MTREPHSEEELSTCDGLRVIVGNCLRQLQENQAGVIQSDDPECIHQMRIGLRRLRLALRLFRKWARAPQSIKQELRWLNDILGPARDSDVLGDKTLPTVIAACPSELTLWQLLESAREIARENRALARLAVASTRFANLITDLSAWLDTAWPSTGWLKTDSRQLTHADCRPDRSDSLRRNARRMLTKQHVGLISNGKQLKRATTETRHRIRIEARDLRHTVEYFQSMFPAKATSRYLRRLAALQEALGSMNDAAVAGRLLLRIEQNKPDLAAAASFARGYLRASASTDNASIDKAWRRFRELRLF